MGLSLGWVLGFGPAGAVGLVASERRKPSAALRSTPAPEEGTLRFCNYLLLNLSALAGISLQNKNICNHCAI